MILSDSILLRTANSSAIMTKFKAYQPEGRSKIGIISASQMFVKHHVHLLVTVPLSGNNEFR